MMTEPSLAELIEQAAEAVRTFNHRARGVILPPDAYRILGEAKTLVGALPQALAQLEAGLHTALQDYDIYDHNRAPDESVAQAADSITAAGELAEAIYGHLEAAQEAISYQGVNTDADGSLIRRPART